ncbi:FAD-binding oxidoreductase [Chloroflexi bacterium]|nr:FAD-binding oxidoreductase [Chloroflexota bacterium]
MKTKHLIDGVQPSEGVINPNDRDELSTALSDIVDSDKVVVPIGGATRLHIGAKMRGYDYALDLSGMNQLVAHNSADLTCVTQSGVTLKSLQDTLKEQGQFLAIDAAFPDQATVGGTLASNATGYMRWQLAHMRDMVIGMEVILPSGTITKSGGPVVKNVSGYDMARLHIGGYGTLGVISEVSFKLNPLPRHQGTFILGFQTENDLHDFSEEVFKSHVMPLALAGINAEVTKELDLKFPSSLYLGLARIGGRQMAFMRQKEILSQIANHYQYTHSDFLEQDSSDILWEKIRDFKGYSSSTNISGRVFSTPTRLRGLLGHINNYFQTIELKVAFSVQPGFGTMEFYFDGTSTVEKVDAEKIMRDLHKIVLENESHLNYEQLPSALKNGFNMWGPVNRGSLALMKSLRNTYDPTKKLNRGRYLTDSE